jgi:hypothetical protein
MVLRRVSVVSLSLLAVAAGGCGSATKDSAGNFKGEPKAVATAVDDLQEAGSKRDADKICGELLSTALVEKIKATSKQTCEKALKESLKDVDAFKLEVVKNGITITGTTATAKVKSESGTGDRTDTLQLVKEPQRRGGKTEQVWKLSALGA